MLMLRSVWLFKSVFQHHLELTIPRLFTAIKHGLSLFGDKVDNNNISLGNLLLVLIFLMEHVSMECVFCYGN